MASDLDAIALLQDPARRALYEYVIAQGRDVGRNEAARALGMQRTLAAFHLDRLAEAGLLEVSFRRLGARSGPGAGRPAKLYRRSQSEHTVTVPPRDYAQAARVLAEAIERSGAEVRLYEVAQEQGLAAGRALASNGPAGETSPSGTAEGLERLVRHLADNGYEPYTEGSAIRLRNCPFHLVAQDFAAVTCGMNLALFEGMLTGASLEGSFQARLDPRDSDCCVVIASKTNHN